MFNINTLINKVSLYTFTAAQASQESAQYHELARTQRASGSKKMGCRRLKNCDSIKLNYFILMENQITSVLFLY